MQHDTEESERTAGIASVRDGKMQAHTSSYPCTLALRSALVMIFSGPSGPKFIADALVVSENVGDGGPGDVFLRLELMARERRERARGMVVGGKDG